MGGSSKSQTIGYRYYLGVHMVLCHGPIDKITRIEFDEKVAWEGNATGGSILVSAESLFGGEEREGGVRGTVDVAMGTDTQTVNSYLAGRLGALTPAFRGVVSIIFRQFYMGMNPYVKRPAFWAQRIMLRQNGLAQWYSTKAAIGADMNPAHIIRECLTDPDWGMGYPEQDVDDTSFQACADQLYTEGMGISLIWDRSILLEEFIQEVLKHIDGSLYVSRTNGKFTLKLSRGGYDVSTLLVLDESSIDKVTDFKRNTIGDLVNSVTVVFWDGTTGKNNSVTVQDIALAAQQQTVIGTTKQFPGFTTGTIAAKVAQRTLKALSSPLASATLYATRKAAALNVGDVFVFSWPQYGVQQLVMRVLNVELGATDNNVVKINAVEDVFALNASAYAAPPPSEWSTPISAPAACPTHAVIEAPYWELVQRMGDTSAQALPSDAGYLIMTGSRPSSDAVNAKIYNSFNGSTWNEAGTTDFTPTASLSAGVGKLDDVFPITSAIDLDLVTVGSYALIDSEIVRIDSVAEASVIVGRGVLDTVVADHSSGAIIKFADAFFETDGVEYVSGTTARIRLLPTTGAGTLAIGSAPTQSVVMNSRAARPYPPANVKINNQYFPDAIEGDLTITWVDRNRLQQTGGSILGWTDGGVTIESGTSTMLTIKELDVDNLLVTTHNIAATGTNTYTLAISAMQAKTRSIEVTAKTVRDGYDSYQFFQHTVELSEFFSAPYDLTVEFKND